MTAERMLKVSEAATRLGVSPPTVRELIQCGELPAMRVCTHFSIREDDLRAFIDRGRVNATRGIVSLAHFGRNGRKLTDAEKAIRARA